MQLTHQPCRGGVALESCIVCYGCLLHLFDAMRMMSLPANSLSLYDAPKIARHRLVFGARTEK